MKKKPQKEPVKGMTTLVVDDAVYTTTLNKAQERRKPYVPHNPSLITSFMPGTIQEVFVEEGQSVKAGTQLCILEAMKMKNLIVAPFNGIVKKMNVKTGQLVPKSFVLVEMEEEKETA